MAKIQSGGIIAAAIFVVLAVLQAGAQLVPKAPLPAAAQVAPKAPLIVHEWGTFTALQDDSGRALGAINADDEPVPDFVERIGSARTQNTSPKAQLTPGLNSKSLSPCHPDVTMRLETPVIYFYPPKGEKARAADEVCQTDVRVSFRGGWLTEFYPNAKAEAPGLLDGVLADFFVPGIQTRYPALKADSHSSLTWSNLKLGAQGDLTQTDDPVWTAPRAVQSALVKGSLKGRYQDGEQSEKFLFYRGVGHINSPLRAVRAPRADALWLYADLSAMDGSRRQEATDLHVPAAWLVEIRPGDGFCAFRSVAAPMDLQGRAAQNGETVGSVSEQFAPGDFSAGRLQELRDAMHKELTAAGLFPDEAAAMLKTWELSYFKSPGRRLFYVTPRGWTEQVLPLTIDGARITRAMIGRIELITPAQRALLTRIAAGPCPDMKALSVDFYQRYATYFQAMSRRQEAGEHVTNDMFYPPSLADLKLAVPPIYQAYLDLGRFRDALILDEQRRRPTADLNAFITGNDLVATAVPVLIAK